MPSSSFNDDEAVLVACSMMEDEIGDVLERLDSRLTVVWMERGYHSKPDRLREVLQEQIDLAEMQGAETILLAYGLCGNGAEGLVAKRARLVMPRYDDCISMLLSVVKREKRGLENAGVYYLTRGWTLDMGAMLQSYDKLVNRLGERKARRVTDMMYDGYREVTVISDGCYDEEPVRDYAKKCGELLRVETGSVPGGTRVLEKLISGDWDDEILVKEPGDPVDTLDFQWPISCPPKGAL